jgi:hypothetical protein
MRAKTAEALLGSSEETDTLLVCVRVQRNHPESFRNVEDTIQFVHMMLVDVSGNIYFAQSPRPQESYPVGAKRIAAMQ